MPDLTTSADVDAMLAAASNAAIRMAIGAQVAGTYVTPTTLNNGTLPVAATTLNATGTSNVLTVTGSSAARVSLYAQNTNSAGNTSFYFENDRGTFASYGGLLHGGSSYTADFFGLAATDKTCLIADGASSEGLCMGTLTNKPVVLGVNNLAVMILTANLSEQRNGTAAQKSRTYHTYAGAGTDYQRAAINTDADYVEIAAETGGTGADDLDMRVTPAGTGVVRFGTHSAIAAETITGFITIKDAGGTLRKVAIVS